MTDKLGSEEAAIDFLGEDMGKVVILIDEYDAAVTHSLDKPKLCKEIEEISAGFYKGIKDSTEYTKFVYVTGIMKYSGLSLFSGNLAVTIFRYEQSYRTSVQFGLCHFIRIHQEGNCRNQSHDEPTD
eukprot:TRINITY_DN867_c0_g1_i1.p3 TRINITY_DN867_c0_g1~~TRINITY_DN867_c0_g1_i1.p3  ORF type:complete len:127 (+),score=8.35 TRINITY_DN867_c0_g1_i1:1033-1413(+)